MAAILEEIDEKLFNILDIRVRPMTRGGEADKIDLLASLLYLYDPSRELARARLLPGQKSLADDSAIRTLLPSEIKSIRRWISVAGLGHLLSEEGLTDPRQFPRTVTALLDRLDQVHSTETLKLKVRNIRLAKKNSRFGVGL